MHEAAAPTPNVDAGEAQAILNHYAISRPYALFMGTLQPRKNLARLLEAYALLRQRDQASFLLVLAGADGWLSEQIHAAIERLHLGDSVRLTGAVSDAEHAALFSQAEALARQLGDAAVDYQ